MQFIQERNLNYRDLIYLILLFPIIGLLFWISDINYLLFHSLVELFSILVAGTIFIIVWNTQKYSHHISLSFLGIAYLFIGIVDLIHTLAYSGMGIFVTYDANLPTQLWILARYIESISITLYELS